MPAFEKILQMLYIDYHYLYSGWYVAKYSVIGERNIAFKKVNIIKR